MITNTTPHDANLRYWYVAVPGRGCRGEERAKRDILVAKIKNAGFKPSRDGLRAKIAAINLAMQIERATGIEMEIGKHDYL